MSYRWERNYEDASEVHTVGKIAGEIVCRVQMDVWRLGAMMAWRFQTSN